jgi:hypothetical protein
MAKPRRRSSRHHIALAAHADDELPCSRRNSAHAPPDGREVDVDAAASRFPGARAQEGCKRSPRHRLPPPTEEGTEKHSLAVRKGCRPARCAQRISFEVRLPPGEIVAGALPRDCCLRAECELVGRPWFAQVIDAPGEKRCTQQAGRAVCDHGHAPCRKLSDLPRGHNEDVNVVVCQGLGGRLEMKRASPQRSPDSFAQDRVTADEIDRRWSLTSSLCSQAGPSWPSNPRATCRSLHRRTPAP